MYFFILFYIFYSGFSFSFQEDYASVSYLDESRHLSSLRDIYNSPFSLCLKDGISVDMCHKISLLFGGKTFQEVFYHTELAKKNEAYFQNIDINVLNTLLRNYLLPPYPNPKYSVPTLGQLKYLIDKNYIKKITGQAYWYMKSSGKAGTTYYGSRPTSSAPSIAMLTRLVAKDFPSACEEDKCEGFYSYQNWILQTASNSAFTTRYYWGYMQKGKSFSSDMSGERNLLIPADATDVYIDIWHAGMIGYVAKYRNLEKMIGTSSILCVKIFGSLVVNSAQIYKKRCW